MLKPAAAASLLIALSVSSIEAQESATLNFGWPAGSEAQVTISTSTSASVMGQTMTDEGEVRYRILAEADGDEMILRYSDFVFDGATMDELVGTGDPEDLTKILSGTQSDIRVDADGQFTHARQFERAAANRTPQVNGSGELALSLCGQQR